jgi:Coenzyme PQQ synthesis protein D (PqqD)
MRLKKNIAISESGYLFNPSTGDSYSVNQMAFKILEFIKEEKSTKEMKEKLIEKYEVGELQLTEDLDDFIGHLKQIGLIDE